MARMLTWPGNDILVANKEPDNEYQKVNFCHTMAIMAAGLEELMLTHAKVVAQTVDVWQQKYSGFVIGCCQVVLTHVTLNNPGINGTIIEQFDT